MISGIREQQSEKNMTFAVFIVLHHAPSRPTILYATADNSELWSIERLEATNEKQVRCGTEPQRRQDNVLTTQKSKYSGAPCRDDVSNFSINSLYKPSCQ